IGLFSLLKKVFSHLFSFQKIYFFQKYLQGRIKEEKSIDLRGGSKRIAGTDGTNNYMGDK
ncbi:MAG TPA: hypothetical protein PKC14_04865, partial [Candidatus Absconditabacterales bacterium]|nr:hypothetical protein [Candidatus Absconditabacterales bacterium]